MFSPMTTFFNRALSIADKLHSSSVTTVFGGHHTSSYPEISSYDQIDVVVVGPVRGSIKPIIDGYKGVFKSVLTTPDDLPMPVREQYYKDIPRIASRYRKVMISLFGCP